MKKKDVFYLVLLVLIIIVTAILAQKAFGHSGSSTSNAPQVEVVTPINSGFDSNALTVISNSNQVFDYSVRLDLTTGLNNLTPFGPLR